MYVRRGSDGPRWDGERRDGNKKDRLAAVNLRAKVRKTIRRRVQLSASCASRTDPTRRGLRRKVGVRLGRALRPAPLSRSAPKISLGYLQPVKHHQGAYSNILRGLCRNLLIRVEVRTQSTGSYQALQHLHKTVSRCFRSPRTPATLTSHSMNLLRCLLRLGWSPSMKIRLSI